jgi:hypothetical protein
MLCETAQEHFSDYIAQELDRAMTLSLENHLNSCESCREEVATLRRTWSALEEMPLVEPPMFFHENLMSRLATEQAQVEEAAASRRAPWDWRALFRPRQLAFGAMALVILLAGAEVVQTQRAALGPIGWVVRLFRPAPAKAVWTPAQTHVVWTPAQQAESTNGALVITITPMPDTPDNGLIYTLTVNGDTSTMISGQISRQPATETLQLSQRPTSVTVTFSDGTRNKSVTPAIATMPAQ